MRSRWNEELTITHNNYQHFRNSNWSVQVDPRDPLSADSARVSNRGLKLVRVRHRSLGVESIRKRFPRRCLKPLRPIYTPTLLNLILARRPWGRDPPGSIRPKQASDWERKRTLVVSAKPQDQTEATAVALPQPVPLPGPNAMAFPNSRSGSEKMAPRTASKSAALSSSATPALQRPPSSFLSSFASSQSRYAAALQRQMRRTDSERYCRYPRLPQAYRRFPRRSSRHRRLP